MGRSEVKEDLGGWQERWDPRLKITFFTNPDEFPQRFQQKSPYQTGDLKKPAKK